MMMMMTKSMGDKLTIREDDMTMLVGSIDHGEEDDDGEGLLGHPLPSIHSVVPVRTANAVAIAVTLARVRAVQEQILAAQALDLVLLSLQLESVRCKSKRHESAHLVLHT